MLINSGGAGKRLMSQGQRFGVVESQVPRHASEAAGCASPLMSGPDYGLPHGNAAIFWGAWNSPSWHIISKELAIEIYGLLRRQSQSACILCQFVGIGQIGLQVAAWGRHFWLRSVKNGHSESGPGRVGKAFWQSK